MATTSTAKAAFPVVTATEYDDVRKSLKEAAKVADTQVSIDNYDKNAADYDVQVVKYRTVADYTRGAIVALEAAGITGSYLRNLTGALSETEYVGRNAVDYRNSARRHAADLRATLEGTAPTSDDNVI